MILENVKIEEIPIKPQLFYRSYSWWRNPIKKYRQRKYIKKILTTIEVGGEIKVVK